jgi:hypothetical protein
MQVEVYSLEVAEEVATEVYSLEVVTEVYSLEVTTEEEVAEEEVAVVATIVINTRIDHVFLYQLCQVNVTIV